MIPFGEYPNTQTKMYRLTFYSLALRKFPNIKREYEFDTIDEVARFLDSIFADGFAGKYVRRLDAQFESGNVGCTNYYKVNKGFQNKIATDYQMT